MDSRPIPLHMAEEIFKYFFGLENMLDDEFLVCRCQTYPHSIILPNWRGKKPRKPLFDNPGARSSLLTTYPMVAKLNEEAGKFTTPNFLAR